MNKKKSPGGRERLALTRGNADLHSDSAKLPALKKTATGMENEEIMAAVCKYFCRGYTPAKIADLMKVHYGLEMSRETPYKFISQAAAKGLLQFIAPREDQMSKKILEHCRPWLQQVEVVATAVFDDVAYRAAVMLMELLRGHRRPPNPKKEVHVGFAGGYSMRKVAKNLADLLALPSDDLPDEVVFHALVSGHNVETPFTDPNSFFTYFFQNPDLHVKVSFVGLYAPAIVGQGQMAQALELPGIKEAYERINELDIIVTSAANLNDEHNMLSSAANLADKLSTDYPDSAPHIKMLHEDGCVGHMLWLPLSAQGPIDNSKYPYRAMTIIELNQLPSFIQRGKQVLLALGPCGSCGAPKAEILKTILNLKDEKQLITHLVVDSRTARELF